jgi:hypothetical protein
MKCPKTTEIESRDLPSALLLQAAATATYSLSRTPYYFLDEQAGMLLV